jgi:hypothetical protein
MIVIYRNGVPTVITGWRAWLIMLAAALAFVVIAGLVLGIALTVWTVLLFALPLMILFGRSARTIEILGRLSQQRCLISETAMRKELGGTHWE